MTYESFKLAFMSALRETRLPLLGTTGEETLDPVRLDRTFRVHVRRIGGEVSPPFYAAASIWFRWDALLTARTLGREEDVLTELHGPQLDDEIQTEQPYVRVDIELIAGLDYGKSLPMPGRDAWARWIREARTRLDTVERIVPEDVVRETPSGLLAVLAWQGEPEIKLRCDEAGELRLDRVRVNGFQIIDIPRHWDDPEREPDDDPYPELVDLFKRVRAVLHAWGEVADHLLPVRDA